MSQFIRRVSGSIPGSSRVEVSFSKALNSKLLLMGVVPNIKYREVLWIERVIEDVLQMYQWNSALLLDNGCVASTSQLLNGNY